MQWLNHKQEYFFCTTDIDRFIFAYKIQTFYDYLFFVEFSEKENENKFLFHVLQTFLPHILS